jgi:hypothetical protein
MSGRPLMRKCRPNMREETRPCRPDMREQVDLICVENCPDAHGNVNQRYRIPSRTRPPKFQKIVRVVDMSEAHALESEAVS